MKAYFFTDSIEPRLAFQEVITEHPIRKNGEDHHIKPFYAIIQGISWISPHVLSSIISANLLDPFDVHEEVMLRYMVSDRLSEYRPATKRSAISMFTSLHIFGYENPLLDMLMEKNIKTLLPPCRVSKLYPDGHPNNIWSNLEMEHKWPFDAESVLGSYCKICGNWSATGICVHCSNSGTES